MGIFRRNKYKKVCLSHMAIDKNGKLRFGETVLTAKHFPCCDKCSEKNHKKVMAEYRSDHRIAPTKRSKANKPNIDEDIRKADEAGMSCGKYQAMLYIGLHPLKEGVEIYEHTKTN